MGSLRGFGSRGGEYPGHHHDGGGDGGRDPHARGPVMGIVTSPTLERVGEESVGVPGLVRRRVREGHVVIGGGEEEDGARS